jgi:hypothetical protein
MEGHVSGRSYLALACCLSLLPAGLCLAQDSPKTPEPYIPGLGDFMTAYVQPHHIKLFLAGAAGNWPLASYEAKELGETFEDVSTYQPVWHDFPIAGLVEGNMDPALAEIEQAIAAKDAGRFKASYARLTAACNACHQATGNDFVAIKPPAASDFPDQDFKPR